MILLTFRVPADDVTSFGQIKYRGREDCIETMGKKSGGVLKIFPCRGSGGKDGSRQVD